MRSINWTVSSTFSTVRFEFKRGALFSLDDAKNNHLIFVGSPSKNLTLLGIPGTEELEDCAVVSLLPGLDPSLHPDSWGGTPPLAHRPRSSMFAGRTL